MSAMIYGRFERVMKTISCLILCVASFFEVEGQSVWNKTYVENRPVMLFSSVVNFDTVLNIIGVTTNKQPPFYAQALTVEIDSNGFLTNYISSPDTSGISTGLFWNTLVRTSQGNFAFCGYGIDSTQHLVFGFINSQFDSTTLFRYHTPNTYAFQGRGLLQYDSNNYYVAGVHTFNLPGNSNVCLAKIDANGNRLWEKYYDQGKSNYAQSMIALNNGNLLLGAVRNDINQPNEKANTWLIEVDTGGTIKRQWLDPNDSTYVAEGLLQTQDGGFIYGARKKNYQSGSSLVSYNAMIVKMDSNFNKQWEFLRGGNDKSIYTGVTDVEELPDGNFIAAGNLSYYGSDSALEGYVVKLHTGGHVIWERRYRGISSSQTLNFLSDIDVLADGSLIAVGQCQQSGHTPPQVGWFLKLDSNGCEIENCLVGLTEKEPDKLQMQIFPNPAADKLNISFDEATTAKEIAVYNTQGSEIRKHSINLSPAEIDIKDLPAGMYFVQLRNEEGIVASRKFVKQ
jgi:hypothetical protein